jgi:hypothetical protein
MFFKRRKFVLQSVTNGLVNEKRKKLIQFATLFHTLKHGRPMHEYEAHKDLFDFLNLILVLWYLNDFRKQNLHFLKLVKL